MMRPVRSSISEQEELLLHGLVDASPVTLLTASRAELEVKGGKSCTQRDDMVHCAEGR
jgi:hypothetical protein